MNKFIIGGAIALLIAIGAFWMFNQQTPAQIEHVEGISAEEELPGEEESAVPQIVYTDAGFSPAELTISIGDTVVFRNESSLPLWTASDPHPLHTIYPELDPREGIPPGETYEFTFDRVGSWRYHNHLNPLRVGTVIVE